MKVPTNHIPVIKSPSVMMPETNNRQTENPQRNAAENSFSIKAILFDLDGVLVDATEWHYRALNRALGIFGFTITRYQHMAEYNGLPTKKKLEMLTVEKGLPIVLHGLINRLKQAYIREEILDNCSPTFEKEYMISRLHREGYRLAVCSNAMRDSVETMLKRSGIFNFFEFVLSAEDVERPKPDPEIYQLALNRMRISPKQALIVEDASHGIESGKRCGGHVCAVGGFPEVDYVRIATALAAVEGAKSC